VMSMPRRIETTHDGRLDHEVDLRWRGCVPLTAYDAPYPRFDGLLPACRVEQVVSDVDHGRLVWSHPGRSGVDPRAVAPLAIVRVADGLGPDPLDPPVGLAAAARELLTGDVEGWLRRPRHRALVLGRDVACLYEVDRDAGRCRTHSVDDLPLQRVADALGDPSYAHCRGRTWRRDRACTQWGAPFLPNGPHNLAGLVGCALQATLRLGGWLRRGVSGTTAWDLARHGVTVDQLAEWHAAGFSTEEVALWWGLGRPVPLARRRDAGESPHHPLELPPEAPADGKRGVTAFVAWKMSCHTPDRYHALVRCSLCRAKDTESPCRTCRAEQRTVAFELEWSDHAQLAALGSAFAPGRDESPVACGHSNCRTSLATSAAAIEGTQQ
jgi:hypothetical protein